MIEQSDFAILDMRYKRLEDCDRDMAYERESQHEIDKRLTVIESRQKLTNWLLSGIGLGLLALLIKVYLGG